MIVKSAQVWAGSFATTDSTGALLASTSAPTAVLYVNGVANAAAVTVTGSNPYKWSVTLPALTAGDTVEIYASATIATIPVSQYVAAATADTSRTSDVAAELAKVPKSDGAVSWNVTALAAINAEVDTALNTAIPGSPTTDSVNERVATMDGRILGTLDTGTHKPQTGDSYPVVTHTDYGNAKLVRSTTPANTLDVSAGGEAGVDWANVGGTTSTVALTNTQINSVSGTVSANVVEIDGETVPVDNLVLALGTGGLVEKLNSALEAAGLAYRFTAEALAEAPTGGGGSGSGTGTYTDTIAVGATPLDGVRVQLSTDALGSNRVYEAYTNALGVFTINPDPGTYYRWLDLAGYDFAQGVAVVVT